MATDHATQPTPHPPKAGDAREDQTPFETPAKPANDDAALLAQMAGCSEKAAASLLQEHGTLNAVVNTPAHLLALKPRQIAAVHFYQTVAVRLAQVQISTAPVLGSWSKLLDYLNTCHAHAANERFHVLFLDKKNHLIRDEIMGNGTVDHVPVYPREVMKRALELNASAIILAHNHPSGDPTPSQADIEMTRRLISAGEPLGVVVHDHVVVGKGRHQSFRSLGLI